MTKLYSVAAMRADLTWDDHEKLNATLDSALEAATTILGTRLKTKFERVTGQVDYYFVRWSVDQGGLPATTYFRLSGAYVTADTVVVTYASSMSALADDPTTATFEIDRDRGLVTIRDADLTNKFVKITYNYGFLAANGTFMAVPAVLKLMAKLQTINVIAMGSPKALGDDYDAAQRSTLQQHLEDALKANNRYMPWAEKPI
jgi:hypothetical protein